MQVKAFRKRRLDKRALTVLGVFLGLEVLACGGAIYSLQSKRAATERTLAAKEANLQTVRVVSASLPALQEDFHLIQTQLAHLEKSLPAEAYVPTLLGQVEQVALANKLRIAEFRPKPLRASSTEEAPEGPKKFEFDLTVNGTYVNVQRFLLSLTRFRKILALTDLNLRPVGDAPKGTNPPLNGQLTFTAYLGTPAGSQAPKPAKPAAKKTTAAADTGAQTRG
jgi:Tfp pilus assembly protein PilO